MLIGSMLDVLVVFSMLDVFDPLDARPALFSKLDIFDNQTWTVDAVVAFLLLLTAGIAALCRHASSRLGSCGGFGVVTPCILQVNLFDAWFSDVCQFNFGFRGLAGKLRCSNSIEQLLVARMAHLNCSLFTLSSFRSMAP